MPYSRTIQGSGGEAPHKNKKILTKSWDLLCRIKEERNLVFCIPREKVWEARNVLEERGEIIISDLQRN